MNAIHTISMLCDRLTPSPTAAGAKIGYQIKVVRLIADTVGRLRVALFLLDLKFINSLSLDVKICFVLLRGCSNVSVGIVT